MFKIQQEGQVICFQLDVQVTQAVPGRWSFAATSGQIMAASCLVVQFFAIFMGIYDTGWWFGTCFIFPYIGNFIIPTDSYFSEGLTPPTRIYIYIYIIIYIYINLQRSYLLHLGYLIVHGETRNFSYLARKYILQCVAVYPRLVVRCHGWSSTVTRHLTSFILGYDLNHMSFIGGYIRWQRHHIRSQYPLDLNQYMLGQVVWNMAFILFHFIYGMSSFPLTNSIIFQDD